jgi:hypothetical protein
MCVPIYYSASYQQDPSEGAARRWWPRPCDRGCAICDPLTARVTDTIYAFLALRLTETGDHASSH